MELKLFTTDNPEVANYNWDIDVVDGLPVLLEESSEKDQLATVAAYISVDSIPLMEDKGNDWKGYLLGDKTLSQVDNQCRKNINLYTEEYNYTPTYSIKDEKLVVGINKVYINSGAI